MGTLFSHGWGTFQGVLLSASGGDEQPCNPSHRMADPQIKIMRRSRRRQASATLS